MSAWTLRPAQLKYQLSDWTLGRVTLLLQVRAVQLAEELAPVAQPEAPAEPLPPGCQGFLIRALPVSSPLPALARQAGFLRYVDQQYPRYYIDLRQSFEDYKAKFSSKTRSTLARKVRKFAEHCGGRLQWQAYRRPEQMEDFMRLARQVSARSYQERLLDAGLPDSAGFRRELAALAAADRVRAFILFDGERPVSYLYCPVQEEVLIYAYLGYDPDYLRLSVGTVLQWLALEQLFGEQRFKYFDFTEGESEHKRLFATHQQRCANLYFIRRGWRNACIVRSHRLLNRAAERLGALLERYQLKSRLRRWMRFGAGG